jgi:hypothetical protein
VAPYGNGAASALSDKIAKDLARNFDLLQKGEWKLTPAECNRLTVLVPRATELEVAAPLPPDFLANVSAAANDENTITSHRSHED